MGKQMYKCARSMRIYWEYKKQRNKEIDAQQINEDAVDALYCLHLDLSVEEWKDYSRAREDGVETQDECMSIIIDGMDLNTIYVPKIKYSVKGIESRYVETRVCRFLVH